MADRGLMATTPLGGYSTTIGGISITEPTGLSLVAIAPSQGEEAALAQCLGDGFGLDWPETGQSTVDGDTRLLGMARDQAFMLFDHDGPDAVAAVRAKLGQAGWLTDQSDGWAILRIAGARSRDALERICLLDLHPEVFTVGSATRTVMEHLSVIIVREEADTFLLMSPTSSAESFLDAVETSVRNILPVA
ncbi:sarcosine oxidase subunit gamma [Minwuia sp.]|uniref:sarcosine oxidase subunit gamma n=1 Tax=Minwuia sp. TaxID=2493630 RepID=UPI003A90F94C